MLSDYSITDQLASDGVYELRRGRRNAGAISVLIKTALQTPPRPAEIAALKREFDLLQSLDLPGIPRPYAVEQDEQSCALLLEDRGGEPIALLSKPIDLGLALQIGIDLANILDRLQRRGIVHNSLHPSSILRHSESGDLQLIDFGDAATEANLVRAGWSQNWLRDKLAYRSPEQTGRMHRSVGYRTDFYSLGVVLYELLTGTLPFKSDDPLELVFWHLAKLPVAPAELRSAIPGPVSEIVMKLLAKAPEERYQSARGLCADLEQCVRQWGALRKVISFPLGRHDISERFTLPTQLYGREREVAVLTETFERSCQGPTAMALVAGAAGVGKTSLINALYARIGYEQGYCISGKFDQLSLEIPYAALLQALKQLIHRWLAEETARVALWRKKLTDALGDNAAVIAQVLPDIETIIGKQPPPRLLPSAEARNRFLLAFQNLFAVVAAPERPLVVFLDDLQWVDAATLVLLQSLIEDVEIRGLFLLGAYRDNEVGPDHGLSKAIATFAAAGTLQRIELAALPIEHLTQLVADTLQCNVSEAAQLAEVVSSKTAGNPFFVGQFLKTLHHERLIEFTHDERRWTYRLEAVRAAEITDNVIHLMTQKIGRLSAPTQHALQLAACVGNRVHLATLAIVSEQDPEMVRARLLEALNAGLIMVAGGGNESGNDDATTFTFLHDRVQQAAYAQIPEQLRPRVHLSVGRLLLQRRNQDDVADSPFEIVGHLNAGRRLVTDASERVMFARLNLCAGRKAKSSTAYESALEYLQAGSDFLDEAHWATEYELAFSLGLGVAECEFLCGRSEAAEQRFDKLLTRALAPFDRADVLNLKLLHYESLSRYLDAIQMGHQSLAAFGLSFPSSREARQVALEREVATIRRLVAERDMSLLAQLPAMEGQEQRMVMKLLTNLHTSCYLSGDKALTMLNTAYMVRLSLERGNTAESAYAYVLYAAMILVPVEHDYHTAYAFGELALRISDRFSAPAIRAKVLMNLGWAVSLWRQPFAESISISREAFRLGNANGMFVEASYASFNECWLTLLNSPELAAFNETCARHADYARRVKMHHFAAAPQLILQWGLALRGLTRHPHSLSDASFDEDAFRQAYSGQPLFEMFYYVAKLAVLYTCDDYEAALEAARHAEVIIRDFPGTIWDELTTYYHGLTLAALYPQLNADQRVEADAKLTGAQQRLKRWADSSRENFHQHYLILSAEASRIRADATRAITFYEEAIATISGCPREPALANELYAKFWLGRGNARIAGVYFREAQAVYGEWGAMAKVRALERRYGALLFEHTRGGSLPGGLGAQDPREAVHAATLDIATIIKAAHAISAEVMLGDFLKQALAIAMENAGARRGLLIEEREGALFIAAEGEVDGGRLSVPVDKPLSSSDFLCSSAVVNYVRRTGSALVLDDAGRDDRFQADSYIAAKRPQSILCMPIVHQAKFSAIVYLENDLAIGAFTPQRVDLLRILLGQAAISLENARLFDRMKREILERQTAEARLRTALTEVEQLKDRLEEENVYLRRDLIANVSHDLRTPLASMRGYLETLLMKDSSLTPNKRRSYLEIAARQSKRLALLVEELFELAKLDMKEVRPNLEPVQLCELAQDVVQKFELAAQQSGVSLATDMPRDAPLVRLDISLMERVFDNLIQNALRHVVAGQQVCVRISADTEQLTVQVRDTGQGIAEQDLPYIFERSYRSDKARMTNLAGAGLGLTITKRILELHNSKISVESKPGAGTCFSFALPFDRCMNTTGAVI